MAFSDRFSPANQFLVDPDNPTDAGVEAGSRAAALRALAARMVQGDAPPQAPWSSGQDPQAGVVAGKPKNINEDDIAHLIGGVPKSSQQAGEGVGVATIDQGDVAHLTAPSDKSNRITRPDRIIGEAPVESSIGSFFKDPLGVIARHPYESGAIAAGLAFPALRAVPPIVGGLASLIGREGAQVGLGAALGGSAPYLAQGIGGGLHYLLRLAGIEHQ